MPNEIKGELNKIRKIQILKKRKRRLEKALIRKYKNQKEISLINDYGIMESSLMKKRKEHIKSSNIIKNEKKIAKIEKRLANLEN